MIIVSKPEIIFSKFGIETEMSKEDEKDYPYFALGVCSAISGAMSSAGAYVFMRRIGTRVHTCLKPMYFGIFSSIMCIVIQGLIELKNPPSQQNQKSQFSMIMPYQEFFLLFFTGVFGWLAQEGVSKAISIEKAGRVAVLNYLQIPICFLFDIIFLSRIVKWTDILGTTFIIFFTFLGSLKKCFLVQDEDSK